MKHRLVLNLALSFLLTCSALHADTNDAEIFSLIQQRLSYMEDVAFYKQEHHIAIEDLPREQKVLTSAEQQAARLGLDPASTSAFFEAQIAAAKAIQYRTLADLQSQPDIKSKREQADLVTVIRPELIRLGNKIIHQLSRQLTTQGPIAKTERGQFIQIVDNPRLKKADKDMLFNALLKVRPKLQNSFSPEEQQDIHAHETTTAL